MNRIPALIRCRPDAAIEGGVSSKVIGIVLIIDPTTGCSTSFTPLIPRRRQILEMRSGAIWDLKKPVMASDPKAGPAPMRRAADLSGLVRYDESLSKKK